MSAYYNENDPKAAAWLRELIARGLIADGTVDERSIADVQATDLAGFVQCHFFAGIGGWSYALRLADWPDDRPAWTGSCPCQPFSVAGKGLGTADKRHLWPEFARLIGECRPASVFGEQVASRDGRGWLAGVRVDLEALGYAVGAADLCAAGCGAPHIRQRLYWVAETESEQHDGAGNARRGRGEFADNSATRGLDFTAGGRRARVGHQSAHGVALQASQDSERMADSMLAGRPERRSESRDGSTAWRSFDVLACTDGKSRRVESGTFPLAHGIPARMGRLRGYGNAIVPQVAAEFVRAAS